MDYQSLIIEPVHGEAREIVMAELSAMGFDSFTEDEQGLQAFIPVDDFRESEISEYLSEKSHVFRFGFRLELIREQNWNALWESAYEPVLVAGQCQIRAPFHQPMDGVKYDIVIEPRMSFGTAHHETTSQMLEALLQENLAGSRVLDQGCGTGVLAILAWKMGASEVVAVDHDPWAFENARDNAAKNNATGISVIQGDAKSIPGKDYQIILANINRNILLQDMDVLSSCLAPGGILLLSGFYDHDLEAIQESAAKHGLHFMQSSENNRWICAKFIK